MPVIPGELRVSAPPLNSTGKSAGPRAAASGTLWRHSAPCPHKREPDPLRPFVFKCTDAKLHIFCVY